MAYPRALCAYVPYMPTFLVHQRTSSQNRIWFDQCCLRYFDYSENNFTINSAKRWLIKTVETTTKTIATGVRTNNLFNDGGDNFVISVKADNLIFLTFCIYKIQWLDWRLFFMWVKSLNLIHTLENMYYQLCIKWNKTRKTFPKLKEKKKSKVILTGSVARWKWLYIPILYKNNKRNLFVMVKAISRK